MNKEELELLKKTFEEATKWRASKSEVETKKVKMNNGSELSLTYLNWATAWRKMKEFYPDANYELVEDIGGNILWNVNGYGMLKCKVSAFGTSHTETFPIMDNRNNAVEIENIDARDINDSAQRGFTKAIARFGIGLYIYEGQFDDIGGQEKAPRTAKAPSIATAARKPSDKQKGFCETLLEKQGYTTEMFATSFGYDPFESMDNCSKAIEALKNGGKPKAKEAPKKVEPKTVEVPSYEEEIEDDDLPF